MQNTERGADTKATITHRQDGSITYHYADETGAVIMTSYRVFPGINVIFKDVHTQNCVVDLGYEPRNILEIEHCREGRAECQVDEEFFYLTPGDITVRRTDSGRRTVSFPIAHYHGVDILIDMDQAPRCLNSLMDDVNVDLDFLIQKFDLEHNPFHTLRKLPNIEHIFSEMYSTPEAVRLGYLKVKVLEVLLFLTGLEKDQEVVQKHGLSQAQVSRAKRIRQYLMDHLGDPITIEKLAETFEISPTNLKSVFRGVYGTSVMAFVRSRRMELAAQMLLETDASVADIADKLGYVNASKFSSAFQNIMGCTPRSYRQSAGTPNQNV